MNGLGKSFTKYEMKQMLRDLSLMNTIIFLLLMDFDLHEFIKFINSSILVSISYPFVGNIFLRLMEFLWPLLCIIHYSFHERERKRERRGQITGIPIVNHCIIHGILIPFIHWSFGIAHKKQKESKITRCHGSSNEKVRDWYGTCSQIHALPFQRR